MFLHFTESKTDPEEDIKLSILKEKLNSEGQQQIRLAVDLLNDLNAHICRFLKLFKRNNQ